MIWELIINEIGIKTIIGIALGSAKNFVYDAYQNNQLKVLIEQNKMLKLKLDKMGDNIVLHDDELKDMGYYVVTVYDYINLQS